MFLSYYKEKLERNIKGEGKRYEWRIKGKYNIIVV